MHNGHFPRSYQPSADEIADLIRRADEHALGTDFLVNGALDSVAALFRVHGFVVDAARDSLRQPRGIARTLQTVTTGA